MGLCTFLLILGPFAALMYVPLTTRMHELQPARAGVSQTPAAPVPVRTNNVHVFTARTSETARRWNNAA